MYDYNVLLSSTLSAGLAGAAPGSHDIVANPRMVAPATDNFELLRGSPALGSGTPTLAPALDFAGNLASSPIRVNRGAYGYTAATP